MSDSMEDNISSVFGSKFLASLTPINISINANNQNSNEYLVDEDLLINNNNNIEDSCIEDKSIYKINKNNSFDDLKNNNVIKSEENTSEKIHKTPQQDNLNNNTSAPPPSPIPVPIQGYVSKVGLGVGRSDNERQFLFLNKRPIDFGKATKAINEVWCVTRVTDIRLYSF